MARRVGRRDVLRASVAGAGMWLGGLKLSELLDNVPAIAGEPLKLNARAKPKDLDDLAYLTIAEAGTLIRNGSVTPSDLVEACLARIKRFDPQIKAFVTVMGDEARAEAKAASARIRRGGPRSSLDGIPIAHKDIIDMKGVRTTAGSKVFAKNPPARHNATIVERLRRAGAIVLGKVNAHEFAFGVWTPPTSNPWDQSRVPGGSSGGSAAAIAAGFALGTTGTDTGGSLRIPASLCNAVGFKPTFGRASRFGVVPLAWTMDHTGPLGRSVEDCALMLNAFAGPDVNDPTTADVAVPDFTAGLGRSIAGRRIGVPTTILFDGVDAETKALVLRAAEVFKKLGAKVVPLEVPPTQQIGLTSWTVVQLVEPLSAHEHYLRRDPQDYMPQTLVLFTLGEAWTAQDYLRAQRIRTINIEEWIEVFSKVDAVLSPATPRPAPTKEQAEATGVFDLVNYTSVFNFNGFPSISVPAGFTSAKLPVGVMLGGRPFDEVRLLQLAYAYQQATKFNRARPPLH